MKAQNKYYISAIVAVVLAVKFSLFLFAAIHAPQAKLLPDSYDYLSLADTLTAKGVFATQNENGTLSFEMFRTPGYPLFLAILKGALKIPLDGVVFIQLAMTLLTAFVVYKTALAIDEKIALLSMVIILFDPPITIFSLTILTETLFLLLISLFMFNFVLYLKHKRFGCLVASALILALATYVRPVSYYMGFLVAFFMIYANRKEGLKKALMRVFVFMLIVYSLLGAWQVRNHARCHNFSFSSVGRENLCCKGLFKSYTRNRDPYTKGMPPAPYYINVSTRCLMSLMTRPGNLKYFKSDVLTAAGKALAYPWMAFWMIGFLWGIVRTRRNIYIQFMLFISAYFIITSIGALTWDVSERLRVSIMPFIAIISASGWSNLARLCHGRHAA